MRRSIFLAFRSVIGLAWKATRPSGDYEIQTINKNIFILLIKMVKRKAGKQGKDQSQKLIKSNSLNTITVGQSNQISDDLVNFSQSQNIPGTSIVGGHRTRPMCCLDVEFVKADHLTCKVCNDSCHDSSLGFDITMMDVICEIMHAYAYGWICPGCQELAKQTKSGKGKKKYICAKSMTMLSLVWSLRSIC